MGCRRMLGAWDRAAIMAGVNVGLSQTRIAHLIGRSPSVVCREIARHTGPDGQYRAEEAGKAARAARRRPKKRLLDCDEVLRDRVIADLSQGHTPRQISGRLREEACGTLPSMDTSPDAQGHTISHEAIDTWIDAHPKKTLIEHGICLPSRRWMRKKPPAPATNPTSTPSPTSSTTAPEPPSATAPPQKHSTNSLLPPIDTANKLVARLTGIRRKTAHGIPIARQPIVVQSRKLLLCMLNIIDTHPTASKQLDLFGVGFERFHASHDADRLSRIARTGPGLPLLSG